MQPEKHDFSRPLSIHLEPDEDLNSSVTLEVSVEQVPCGGDPKVSCYKSNGCIVFEGYCPIDSQNPFSECGIRNSKTDSKQKQDIPWSKETGEKVPPFGPFMHWDVIPKLLHDIINGAGLKMSEQKNPYSERDRPSIIYPRITGRVSNVYSSDEISLVEDPFEKKRRVTVGNILDTKKPLGTPVVIDNTQIKSPEAGGLVTKRKWKRRKALHGEMKSPLLQQLPVAQSGAPKEERMSAVLSAYTQSVPLRHQSEEYHIKRDIDSMTVSISSSDTGEIEVDLSEEGVNVARGSSEVIKSLADAAVGTGRIDEDASECVLCGSPLHCRKHDHRRHAKDASTTGQSSRAMHDAPTHTSAAEHTQKPKHRSTRKENTVYSVTDNQGQQSRATTDVFTQALNAGHTKHSKVKTVRQEDTAYPAATSHGHRSRAAMEMSTHASHEGHKNHSKERTRKHEVTAYPVATNQGQLSREMTFASTHASTAEHKEHAKEKHPRHEITAYPVQTFSSGPSRDAGTSTVEDSEMSDNDQSEMPNTFDNEQNISAYPMSRGSGSFFKRSSKGKDDIRKCTMQHVLFPKNNCPYSPSLTSLPLDESDIEYIIRRAQLAKSSLPADTSLCPMERWQLRGYNRPSSKSGRSHSSG